MVWLSHGTSKRVSNLLRTRPDTRVITWLASALESKGSSSVPSIQIRTARYNSVLCWCVRRNSPDEALPILLNVYGMDNVVRNGGPTQSAKRSRGRFRSRRQSSHKSYRGSHSCNIGQCRIFISAFSQKITGKKNPYGHNPKKRKKDLTNIFHRNFPSRLLWNDIASCTVVSISP
jgi:hypothetical protein